MKTKVPKTVRRNPSRSSQHFLTICIISRGKSFISQDQLQVAKAGNMQIANDARSVSCAVSLLRFHQNKKKRFRRKRFLKVFFWYHFEMCFASVMKSVFLCARSPQGATSRSHCAKAIRRGTSWECSSIKGLGIEIYFMTVHDIEGKCCWSHWL